MKMKIFSDFDGTITNSDNMVMIIDAFVSEEYKKLKHDVLNQRISIREGVATMIESIPSSRKEEVITHVLANTTFRDGFSAFVSYVNEGNIPFYVLSGGLDFFVYALLENLVPSEHIRCNEASFSEKNIELQFPYNCDGNCKNDCGMCKPSVIRQLANPDDYIVVIGDSITDLQMAKMANLVFARDFLAQKCDELGIAYVPFHSFHDVTTHLQQLEV